jgi:peptide/nickel transport system substrate-binding protein
VKFDKNLKIVPGLASTWGNLNPTTWQLKLRRGVLFHDGSPFTAEDVLASFETAKKQTAGEIQTYLRTIQEIKKIDDATIEIITQGPDPLILSRLTKFFITKKENVGTGPYTVDHYVPGKILSLKAFPDYWGRQPSHARVDYVTTIDRNQRSMDFESGKTDVLVAVPPEQAALLPQDQIKTHYSLEVNFLLFNLQDEAFKDLKTREAISKQFDPARIETIGNSYVRQANQFIAPGVFGYNPSLPLFKYDEATRPKALFGERLERLTLDYLPTYRTLAQYLQAQLRDAGYLLKLNELSPEALLEKIRNNESQLFLLGWQSENGDAGDFLEAFIHSQGEFNGGRFSNAELDGLIEASRSELNPEKRLKMLQDLMARIDAEKIGVPLFESSRLYAVKKGIEWEPRLDGLVLAEEIH